MLAILRRHEIFDVDPHLAALADDEVDLLADRMVAHRPLADEHFVAADRFEHRRLPARQRNAQPLGLLVLHPKQGFGHHRFPLVARMRSEEHTSELQSLMRISYAVFCLKKKINHITSYANESDLHRPSVTDP